MATTVTYKNNTLVTVNNQTKTLKTAGKYLEDDITLVDISGGVEAVSIVDTPDAAGGTVRTVTAVDISDTTAAAADVVQGKYFYTADGTKTAGTAYRGGFIASGTYTGDGTAICTVPVGKKMPKTNFLFHMYAPGGTEYVYNSTYKYAELTCIITDTIASYDLSSNGTKSPAYTGNITWSVNNSGTITNVTNYSTGYLKYIRSATTAVSYQGQSGRPQIIRGNNGFSVYYSQGNNNYAFVSGLIYNWELYYFGSNPSTDIVEVE